MYELSAKQLILVSGGTLNIHVGTDGAWIDGSPSAYVTAAREGWNWMVTHLPLSAPAVTQIAMLQLSRWARE